ncbi:MAG: DUF551 domain-containing protein [Oscillospiraceae bacterium]|nr:DUF551 domain-containing protein [Oscillospiraceae bacterium]
MKTNELVEKLRNVMPHCWSKIRKKLEDIADEIADTLESQQKRIAELEAERRWIPVTERLPDKELWEFQKRYNQDAVEVLVMIKGAKTATTLYYNDEGDFCDEDDRSWLVTHWMPMPEPQNQSPASL